MLSESQSTTKLVVLLGDAPAHGRKFHNGVRDRFEDGDPNGRDPCEYMERFARHHVDFSFVQINSSTDKVSAWISGCNSE